jgi:hypothetical protein
MAFSISARQEIIGVEEYEDRRYREPFFINAAD